MDGVWRMEYNIGQNGCSMFALEFGLRSMVSVSISMLLLLYILHYLFYDIDFCFRLHQKVSSKLPLTMAEKNTYLNKRFYNENCGNSRSLIYLLIIYSTAYKDTQRHTHSSFRCCKVFLFIEWGRKQNLFSKQTRHITMNQRIIANVTFEWQRIKSLINASTTGRLNV